MNDIERLAKDFVDMPKADRKGQMKLTDDKMATMKLKTLEIFNSVEQNLKNSCLN